MHAYIDTSVAAIPDERALTDCVALLGQDEQATPSSWIGICNLNGQIRLVLESFSVEQDERLSGLLRSTGLVNFDGLATVSDALLERVEQLDLVLGLRLH
jgi:hypothetical protein